MKPTGDAREPDYENDAKVRKLFERALEDARHNTARLARDRQDLMNLLFERGGPDNQWIIYNSTSNTWETRPYDGKHDGPTAYRLQHDPVSPPTSTFPTASTP